MPDYNGNFVKNSGLIVGNISQSVGSCASQKAPPQAVQTEEGKESTFSYDVAISYASEQEQIVSRAAKILSADGFKVFFAPEEERAFIAEDMISSFYRIYRYESRFVAAFVTEDYLRKDITMFEATTAMLRRREEGRNCLIPIYFGEAKLPCLDPDIHCVKGDGLREVELADKIRTVLLSKRQ